MTDPPVIFYASRSQAEEPGKDSTGDQLAIIRRHVGRAPVAEHVDHASGSKRSRGPGLEAAIADAKSAAAEHGSAELWAWHSARFGRGSGKLGEARAVGELFYAMRRAGVALRTVENDSYVTDEMLIGFAQQFATDPAVLLLHGAMGAIADLETR